MCNMSIEEVINSLTTKKKEWSDKRDEMTRHTLSYDSSKINDQEYISEFHDKLVKYGDELREIGNKYHEEVSEKAHEIAKDYEDNEVIQNVLKDIESDIDLSNGLFPGGREEKIKFLYDLILLFKKMR